jgi:DNA repair photolyase
MEYKSFYKTVGGNEGSKCKHSTRLDTYGCGCSHDCKYCYAKSLLSFRGLWNPEEPASADVEKIRRKVKRIPKEVIRLGGMTDCFQPIEKTRRVTYETIKALNEQRVPYLIVTKSAMVADPEYVEILDKCLAHVQITVTTTDDARSLTYEKASVPSERIRAIETLYDAGVDVQFRLSPYIDTFVDTFVINDVRCEKMVVEFLRVNHWIQKWFDLDYSRWTHAEGGYRHMELDEKLRLLEPLKKRITVCEDCTEHYEYWKEHVNPNKEDCCDLRAV